MLLITMKIFSVLTIVKSAKILVVVPTPLISHQVIFRPLLQELINRNHELTIITTEPVYPNGEAPKNLREINLHDLSYNLWNKILDKLAKNDQEDDFLGMSIVFPDLSRMFMEQLKSSMRSLLSDKAIKFDLLIIEACVTPALIFSHIFEAPVIQISSFGVIPGNMEVMGAVTHPFLYPMLYHKRFHNLSIWEKIINLHQLVTLKRILQKQELNDNVALQNILGDDIPPLSQLKSNVHMLFLNVHPIWMNNQPVPPNVVYMWGIHKTPEKPLPEELQNYLDSSKNGTIYVSFGSNVRSSSLGSKKLEILLKVFSQLPYDILWKWEMDDLPGKSDNIKISKWFPQCDVLRHPNLKLFITQGGLQSTDEAINAGVPLIGIPVFADQEFNTEKYVQFEIGMKLNFKSLNVEDLTTAINNIFKNYESYRRNVVNLRMRMHDQPKPALENAVWWVEYVLRHGGARHLHAPAASMSWTEYYELELVFVILGGLTVLMTLLISLVYFSFKYMTGSVCDLYITKSKVL